MVTALPWDPPGHAALGAAARRLCAGCRAQGERGAALAAWLGGMREELESHMEWLDSGVDWEAIATSCPSSTLARLSASLGTDSGDPDSSDLFLAALTTLPTYEDAWGLALRHSAGEARARLRRIRAIEDRANGANGQEFSAAEWLCRGLGTDEFEGACAERAGPGETYGIISFTTVPRAALKFALRHTRQRSVPHAIAVLDAALARGLGARPALYSLAADVLNMEPREERAYRASKLLHADEAQAHFDQAWPRGSSLAIRAVAAVGDQSPHDLRRLERTGIPVVPLEDLL